MFVFEWYSYRDMQIPARDISLDKKFRSDRARLTRASFLMRIHARALAHVRALSIVFQLRTINFIVCGEKKFQKC
jgi:hypothetical protein